MVMNSGARRAASDDAIDCGREHNYFFHAELLTRDDYRSSASQQS